MTEQLAKPVPRCAYEDDLLGISRCTRIEDLYDTDFGWLCNEHYRMTIRMVAYESRVRELEQALQFVNALIGHDDSPAIVWDQSPIGQMKRRIAAALHVTDKAAQE